MERVIETHFEILVGLLEEILVELKRQSPPAGVTGGGATGVDPDDLIGKKTSD